MLSYVLLLVIVIGLSVAVYAYLQLQAPKARLTCGDDVLLVIDPAETTCVIKKSTGTAELRTLVENRGKKAISGAYVRIGPQTSNIRSLINKDGNVFFGFIPESQSSVLLPGKAYLYAIDITDRSFVTEGENILEVQPVIGEGKEVALCEQATVTQRIKCNRVTT